MAVRLQMKLGVVAEQDRLPDSPDTVVVVEPSSGSVARAKGHLYLLVASRVAGPRAAEATRLAAETIRNEYYYDESGIRTSIQKAIGLANKRLGHQADRLELGTVDETTGPIGVAAAIVRGNELYVTTVGPADAYLVRQARLSTLPDPQRDRGLPTSTVRPNVWRGEVQAGDELVLISPNVVERLGVEELKDALVTLHPQSAMEHLHHRFVAAGGTGSDAALAFEAAEPVAPVRIRERRWSSTQLGLPDRRVSGAPDDVLDDDPDADDADADADRPRVGSGRGAALGAGAAGAWASVAGPLEGLLARLRGLRPAGRQRYRKVSPMSARRENQRRAAVAALAFVAVAFGLGMAVLVLPRDIGRQQPSATAPAGQRALEAARADLARVIGPGVDLVAEDPDEAQTLLEHAGQQLDLAAAAGIPAATIDPLRAQVIAQLERIYDVTVVDDTVLFAFKPDAVPKIDVVAVVQGPAGAPYVLDRTTKAVWRISTEIGRATLVLREGVEVGGVTAGVPVLLASAGPDLLIVDANDVVWRWQPSDEPGRGSLETVQVDGSDGWGSDVLALGTFLTSAEDNRYNLYAVDPTEEQILAFSPTGSGSFPDGEPWLNEPRPLTGVTSIHVDGDIYLAEAGALVRFAGGAPDGWAPGDVGDEALREPPAYTVVAAASGRRAGRVYAYDRANARVLAFDKSGGAYLEQFRLPDGNDGFADIRSMYVIEPLDGPPSLVWASADVVHQSTLRAPETPDPDASGDPAASPEPSAATP